MPNFTVYHTSEHSIIRCSEWVPKYLLCLRSQTGSCQRTDIMPKTYLNYAEAERVTGFRKSTAPRVPATHQDT